MIILPIHIFFDDKPSYLPKLCDEEYIGIKRRSIQNTIKGRTTLSDSSFKKIYRKLSLYCDETPPLRMVTTEEEFLLAFKSMDPIKLLNCFHSDNFQYYAEVMKPICELDAYLEKELKLIDLQPPETHLECVWRLLSNSDFPGTMLEDNLVKDGGNSIQNLQKIFTRLTIDLFFFIVAAWDVTYTQSYLKKTDGEKPIFLKFLPFLEGNVLMNPMRLFFEHIQDINEFENEHELATAIPLLGVSPKDTDPEIQKRMLRKWKAGKMKQLPSWENIYSMVEILVKRQNLNMDDWESYKAQAQLVYSHIKIFQNLLNIIMTNKLRELHGLSIVEIVDFFERYLYWYNYHTVMYTEKSINTLP